MIESTLLCILIFNIEYINFSPSSPSPRRRSQPWLLKSGQSAHKATMSWPMHPGFMLWEEHHITKVSWTPILRIFSPFPSVLTSSSHPGMGSQAEWRLSYICLTNRASCDFLKARWIHDKGNKIIPQETQTATFSNADFWAQSRQWQFLLWQNSTAKFDS